MAGSKYIAYPDLPQSELYMILHYLGCRVEMAAFVLWHVSVAQWPEHVMENMHADLVCILFVSANSSS